MENGKKKFKLLKKKGRYHLQFEKEEKETPVKVVWARPLSGQGKEVAFMDDKKKEVAMIEGLHCLDAESQTVAREALDLRYLAARIARIMNIKIHFGTRYWDVETDLGRRQFAMKNPNRNIAPRCEDGLLLRDIHGDLFTIDSVNELDKRSQQEIRKII